MYSVSTLLYEKTLTELLPAVGRKGYYSGSLDFRFGEVECRLVLSVFVYRQPVLLPEGAEERIADLVPVWWEFHTTTGDGEQLNDFDFGEMKLFL